MKMNDEEETDHVQSLDNLLQQSQKPATEMVQDTYVESEEIPNNIQMDGDGVYHRVTLKVGEHGSVTRGLKESSDRHL